MDRARNQHNHVGMVATTFHVRCMCCAACLLMLPFMNACHTTSPATLAQAPGSPTGGDSPPACEAPTDCPEDKTCIKGRCVEPECKTNDDCDLASICYRGVCKPLE